MQMAEIKSIDVLQGFSFAASCHHEFSPPSSIPSIHHFVMESVKKIVSDGKHVVRELGKSEVNFLKCTVTPSFYVINQKQGNC